jgi:hypothetical protein
MWAVVTARLGPTVDEAAGGQGLAAGVVSGRRPAAPPVGPSRRRCRRSTRLRA